MSSISFKNYSSLASKENVGETELSGRYMFQQNDEKRIVPDVVTKLDLNKNDTLLEIGSGPGNLLIPISDTVGHAAAIDSAPVLGRMLSREGPDNNISTYPGNFLFMDLPKSQFSKVLIYSVFQYLNNVETAHSFLERALSLLLPGGGLLLGDLPNIDKKERFLKTEPGRHMSAEWSKLVSDAGTHPLSILEPDVNLITINDAFIMRLLAYGRENGFETYLLAQPPGLPFCYTREDILFIAPS